MVYAHKGNNVGLYLVLSKKRLQLLPNFTLVEASLRTLFFASVEVLRRRCFWRIHTFGKRESGSQN